MNLFGEEDSEIQRDKRRRAKSSSEVLTREERRFVLSEIAKGKAVDTWVMYRDSNLKVRLTPSVADRIRAIQILNDMDSLQEIKAQSPHSISFFDEYLNALKESDDKSSEGQRSSEQAQSEPESSVL